MVYHALVLLNLHVFIAFSLSPHLFSLLKDLRRADCPASSGSGSEPYLPFLLAHAGHISYTGAFGIRVFDALHRLCSFLALLFVNTIVLQYINIIIFFVSLFAPPSPPPHSSLLVLVLKQTNSKLGTVNVETVLIIQLSFVALATLAPQILMIIATERMILANNVGAGEGRWTFVQSVALAVAIMPVRDVIIQALAMSGRVKVKGQSRTRERSRWKEKASTIYTTTPPDPPYRPYQIHNQDRKHYHHHSHPYQLFTNPLYIRTLENCPPSQHHHPSWRSP